MNGISSLAKWQFSFAYIEDIFIFSLIPSKLIAHFQALLKLECGAGVSLKLPKCSFFKNQIDYLGQVIQPGFPAVSNRTPKEGL